MDRQQKLLNILIGHIITCVEDMHVKPEHRRDNDHATIPEGEHFMDTCMKVLHAEAENCHYTLEQADIEWFTEAIENVGCFIRN